MPRIPTHLKKVLVMTDKEFEDWDKKWKKEARKEDAITLGIVLLVIAIIIGIAWGCVWVAQQSQYAGIACIAGGLIMILIVIGAWLNQFRLY